MSLLLIVICGICLCQPTVNGGFNKTVFLFSVQAGRGANEDYWDEDFDDNKNCEQEEKITELNKEVGVPLKIVFCSYNYNYNIGHCRNYFTILQANDGAAPSQCSSVPVSFLNVHT